MDYETLKRYQELVNELSRDWERVNKELYELNGKLEEEKDDGKEE